MSDVLKEIEIKLDKTISKLEKVGNVIYKEFPDGSEEWKGNKNIIEIIDDLEKIKQILLIQDITKMSGQIKWNTQKG